jgi:hypothetical protein
MIEIDWRVTFLDFIKEHNYLPALTQNALRLHAS